MATFCYSFQYLWVLIMICTKKHVITYNLEMGLMDVNNLHVILKTWLDSSDPFNGEKLDSRVQNMYYKTANDILDALDL